VPSTDDTRAKLLQAAKEVFSEQGFYGATIREICQKAGVNIALVNYYFGDKQELYTEVLRTAVSDPGRLEEMRALFDRDLPPEKVLREVIRIMVVRIVERRERDRGQVHLRLMTQEMTNPTPAFGRVIDETIKPIHDLMCKTVGSILRLPEGHDSTRLCTQSIIGQVMHYAKNGAVISRLWPELKMDAEHHDQIATHIADFSLAYLRSLSKSIAARKAARRTA
jgi:AcrR family transcriptional regulator